MLDFPSAFYEHTSIMYTIRIKNLFIPCMSFCVMNKSLQIRCNWTSLSQVLSQALMAVILQLGTFKNVKFWEGALPNNSRNSPGGDGYSFLWRTKSVQFGHFIDKPTGNLATKTCQITTYANFSFFPRPYTARGHGLRNKGE